VSNYSNRRTPPDKVLVSLFAAHPDWTDQEYLDELGSDVSVFTLAYHRRRLQLKAEPKLGIDAMSDKVFWGIVDGCQLERLS
jgi:hypothetical protein